MRIRFGRPARGTLLPALAMLLSACASTGATAGSGVGDRMLDRPPYAAGRAVPPGARLAYFPITFQAGSTQSPIFDPSPAAGTPVAAMLEELNRHLESGAAAEWRRLSLPGGTPPDVMFGCEQYGSDECVHTAGDLRQARRRYMRLAVGRPSPAWSAATASQLDAAGSDAVVVLTLEVGQYWVHQRNLLGSKEVRLGRDHLQPVAWLTSLDQPVQVLQITGALVDRDGKAIRIAAEGLWARRTNILLSGIGAQALVTDEDVERLRTARREELPGQPLVWQVALENVLRSLLSS